ncbi:transporter [Deltaproteobacteria bacterium Smac51]|nr:transporter [Deltaproteobacteria bacterium Smac51]
MNTSVNNGSFKFLDLITALFATLLIVSNYASTRIIDLPAGLSFDAGTLMFPFTYIFNDLLTEVYGYKRSRRVIWIGFLALLISALSMGVVGLFPPAEGWEQAAAWDSVMGVVPRIVVASLAAYFVGEFVNSVVLAKLKVKTGGRHLWFRLIGSTAVGQIFDTLIFASIAFIGVLDWDLWLTLVISNYIFKVGIEVVFLPVTAWVVNSFKKIEKSDVYDRQTSFSPFHWSVDGQ